MALVLSQPSDEPEAQFIYGCLDWYKNYLFKEYENASSRLYDLENLCNQLILVDSLSEFAAEILLDHVESDEDEYDSQLIISTIHSAKGKEWDCVYILNVADGSIPLHRPSIDFEEERRLLYVAITRAKQQLYLYWPGLNRMNYNKNSVSPFLKILNKNEKQDQCDPYYVEDNDDTGELFYVYDDSGIF